MPKRDRPLYAVLIDADNIPARYAGPMLKEIASFGEPALRRVYGDWSANQLKGWAEAARTFGLVTHQETANTSRKNATDIGMVIDAMDILHTGRFDGFVLISSDSDFTALANRIREQGLEVIGIGEAKTNAALRSVCNRFIIAENLVEELAPENKKSETKSSKRPPSDAIPLIISAMEQIEQDDDWYPLSQIGSKIMATHSDFDTRTYGKQKLSELVKGLKQFETRKTNNQLQVRRSD
ncbi:NYN domain-containing protein [Shimia sp.]|uniref:NYN domain-containing protein n=1 Tax=Shimia sp. TaxID=1954381 RepID=UPI003298EE96